jgi:hypothetical protein
MRPALLPRELRPELRFLHTPIAEPFSQWNVASSEKVRSSRPPAAILICRDAESQSSKLRTPPLNPRFTFSHIHLITRTSL